MIRKAPNPDYIGVRVDDTYDMLDFDARDEIDAAAEYALENLMTRFQ